MIYQTFILGFVDCKKTLYNVLVLLVGASSHLVNLCFLVWFAYPFLPKGGRLGLLRYSLCTGVCSVSIVPEIEPFCFPEVDSAHWAFARLARRADSVCSPSAQAE